MVIGFSGLLFFLLIGFVLTRIYLRFLRIAYIDDSFLYISKIDSTETTIPLDKIKSVEYSSFPASTKTERFILIKYYDEKMTLKKVLINPAHLDRDSRFKWNKNILGLIKGKIKNYTEFNNSMANKA